MTLPVLSHESVAFFGPKESQSKKVKKTIFRTIFDRFSDFFDYFRNNFIWGELIFFIETLMVSRNYRVETKLHGRGVKFRETIKITKKHRKWFRGTRVNSKKSGFVGLSNSRLFGFAGVVNSKIGPTLTLLSELGVKCRKRFR